MMPNGEHQKDGPVHSWPRIKSLTPRHLCENPYCCISIPWTHCCVIADETSGPEFFAALGETFSFTVYAKQSPQELLFIQLARHLGWGHVSQVVL